MALFSINYVPKQLIMIAAFAFAFQLAAFSQKDINKKNQCDDGSHRVFLETKKRYPPVFREGVIISLRVAQGESLQPATDTIPQKQSPESQEEVVSSHE